MCGRVSRRATDALKYNIKTNMRVLMLVITLLLLTAGKAYDTEIQGWTCGSRGLCRKHCYAQEHTVGYHGCPRRYRCCALRF
ncbi:beta-defensin-like 3 [Misgurnus anguillicaudatus]|uniref:beta-defensin-like 3 n=1 Tax=Misgurnus anguillicaudatus TaxID=75329 RepID=UPI003CCF4E68